MILKTIVVLSALSAACMMAARTLFHSFQLESYQFPGYFRTLKRQPLKALIPGLLMNIVWAGGGAALTALIPKEQELLLVLSAVTILLAFGWLILVITNTKKAKKPLVFTPRMVRLCVTAFLVFLALLLFFALAGTHVDAATGEVSRNALFSVCIIFPFLLPLWVALAGLLAWPMEKMISELYFQDAQKILKARPDLIRIGITGSWGKTSVKFILGTMLEEKYHTLVTPASYNTPMGVTRVIRTMLEPGHRVFVAEMGARHVGDIRELCRLVHPQLGVITSVGPQHLDTFKTVERVASTKYELIQALPKDGTAFFADDGGICRELYGKTKVEKLSAGLDDTADVWAENLQTTSQGTRFTLCTKAFRAECETAMLGELNIRNILLSTAVCLKLGLTERQIVRGIARLKPVEHRLQLIPNPGGISVIDDAFNSNIRGAEQALQVLKELPPRRIVVTPGMVELGDQEKDLNRQLGEKMAVCCDIAIPVGLKRGEPIVEGLKGAGFPEENIHPAADLESARAWIAGNAAAGDTILFENDLPDNYTE